MATPVQTVRLPRSLGGSLAAGHPWVYRDHVPGGFQAKIGTWVKVEAGDFVGYALWDPDSPLALRVFSARGEPDAEWVSARVRAAFELRAPLRDAGCNAYRWIHGEGDGLPGIVVDVYAGYAVLVTYSAAVEPLVRPVVDALRECTRLRGVLHRPSAAADGGRVALKKLWGRQPTRDLVVEEHGVRLHAALLEGQKTGLFLDQRENRSRVGGIANGRSVLNLFCYTGGFSVHAALGGAVRVVSVDAAAGAVDAARGNFDLNGIDPEPHEFVTADAWEYLEQARQRQEQFDLVISDPPSFARSRGQVKAALKAYQRLHLAALRVTRPGGLYAAASCTAQVSPEAFQRTLAEAAKRARRRLQIVHDAGQPIDHPVMAQHPEGRYLKFMVCRVLTAV